MKLRKGFVSNSSTTSFCIYGCCLDSDEAKSLLLATGAITEEQLKEDEYGEVFYKVAEDNNVTYECSPYDEEAYFGFSFTSIPDDAVVGEWKKEKEELLKKLFGDTISCGTHQEAWRDG